MRPLEFVTSSTLPLRLAAIATTAKTSETPLQIFPIGNSRCGTEMYGIRVGTGAQHVSITAGAHSDEPAGPLSAVALLERLADGSAESRRLCETYTFNICPQVNPDGADANSEWFSEPPEPYRYLEKVIREEPGLDVEFGYPSETESALRPENAAVAAFLKSEGPYIYHASLHGMALAEGAWYLINREWAARTGALQTELVRQAGSAGLGLHDIQRHGEKGFSRIAPGFCTTPVSSAMKTHFRSLGNDATALLFRPSSMEFIQSLGGDPLLMVSELPMFVIGKRHQLPEGATPEPGTTAFEKLRVLLPAARAQLSVGNREPLSELIKEFKVTPLPFSVQIKLQLAMVMSGLKFLEQHSIENTQ